MRREQRGFTFIELVMVMALTGVLLTAGASTLRRALAREEVDGWARSIAYDIMGAQQAAMTRRTNTVLAFQNQTYSIVADSTTLRQQMLPTHISLGSITTLSFDRRGIPSAGITLTVTSALSGRSYIITVETVTGRVTFSET